MLKKLQKNFIRIAALALFSVLFLVILSINGVFLYQSNLILNNKLEDLMRYHTEQGKNQTYTEKKEEKQGPKRGEKEENPEDGSSDSALDFFPQLHKNMQNAVDCCVVTLGEDQEILEVWRKFDDSFEEETLTTLLSAIEGKTHTRGWHQTYKYLIREGTDTEGAARTYVAIIDASSSVYSVISVVVISLAIGLGTFLIILLLIVAASRRAIQPLAESYQKQHQFITDAGHELKTPLTVISANSELARMTYGDSEWFDGIDRQVQRMNHLVRDMITLARMDEEQKITFETFCLSDAVYDVVLPFEQVLERSQKHLSVDITDGIRINGNESLIRQLVSILMDNAAKYCDEGGTSSVCLKTDSSHVRLLISNDFADAASCEFDRIFDRFYRGDKTRKSDGSYGLGLSIAQNIVNIHSGTITAKAAGAAKVQFEVVLKK